MKKGFTLIELLVVVLIIGILSSVALPQYQKAVGKARVAEAKVGLNALAKAGRLYFLETGEKPIEGESNSSFSIELPSSQNWSFRIDECCLENGKIGCSWEAVYSKNSATIRFVEEEYNLVCNGGSGDANYVGFICAAETEKECKDLGFSKGIGDLMYKEN